MYLLYSCFSISDTLYHFVAKDVVEHQISRSVSEDATKSKQQDKEKVNLAREKTKRAREEAKTARQEARVAREEAIFYSQEVEKVENEIKSLKQECKNSAGLKISDKISKDAEDAKKVS